MNTVGQILNRKQGQNYTLTPDTHVIDALHLMEDKNIGAVIVVEAGKYVGMMTERDYARKVITKGRRSVSTNVGDIMTTDLPRVTKNDSVDTCMQLMTDNNLRYLPVMDDENFVGIISIIDLVKEKLIEQASHIESLEGYIRNSY